MNKKGYTLIELLSVIVIIGLVIGIVMFAISVVLSGSKEKYYKSIENNILLASNNYFEDYRYMQPINDDISEVSIIDLVEKKYIEIIKDSSGNECTNGKVYAYRENNNTAYKVCLECNDYKSEGSFCDGPMINEVNITNNQIWKTGYSDSIQEKDFQGATSLYGKITYSVISQKKGLLDVNLFSLSSPNMLNLKMLGGTSVGTYNVIVRAESTENSLYKKDYKDINLTIKVQSTANIVIDNVDSSCNSIYVDDMDTQVNMSDDIYYFSGENNCVKNNYLWYSGKMWRIVAIYPDGRMKLVTEDVLTSIYWGANTDFNNSWIYQWLNEDFYNSLYNANNIVDKSIWNYSIDIKGYNEGHTRPENINNQSIVSANVGLLNRYENYLSSINASSIYKGYLNLESGLSWWLLSPISSSSVIFIGSGGGYNSSDSETSAFGVRPAIVIKANVKFSGDGSKANPYKIIGDKNTSSNDYLLNSRLVGEYVKFDNNIYRIVSVKDGITKLVMADMLRDNKNQVMEKYFASSPYFGKSTNEKSNAYWDYYLNNTWYNNISSKYKNMLVDETYYLGLYRNNNYKSALCKNTNLNNVTTENCTKYDMNNIFTGKVGLLRVGEMFSTSLNNYLFNENEGDMWLITLTSNNETSYSLVTYVYDGGSLQGNYPQSNVHGVRPTITLKPEIKIIKGNGIIDSPFEISE